MGLCLEGAGKLTVVERRVGKTSNLWRSSEQVVGPLQSGAFSASGGSLLSLLSVFVFPLIMNNPG